MANTYVVNFNVALNNLIDIGLLRVNDSEAKNLLSQLRTRLSGIRAVAGPESILNVVGNGLAKYQAAIFDDNIDFFLKHKNEELIEINEHTEPFIVLMNAIRSCAEHINNRDRTIVRKLLITMIENYANYKLLLYK